MKFLGYADLAERGIKLHKTTIWRLERAGKFPRRIPISDNRIGWLEDDVDYWMKERADARSAKEN
jgi:prophage regulatory protein